MNAPLALYDLLEYQIPSKARFHDGREFVLEDSADAARKKLKNPKLAVRIKATHSGVLINHRVYPGVHMRDSVGSWLEAYPKPILDRHPTMPSPLLPQEEKEKVLGRISKAKYVQLVNDALFINDFVAPENPGSEGSGYIELTGVISDEAAIEETLDGRKLTVSTGADKPTRFLCSICGQDWIKSGNCDHELGQIYVVDAKGKKGAKKLAFGITGRLKYNHVAFTWRPADYVARIESTEILDEWKDCSYLNCKPSIEKGQLLALRLIDSESGSFLDMDLTNSTMSKTDTSEQAKAETAIDLRAAVLDQNSEDVMSQPTTDSTKKDTVQATAPKAEDKPVDLHDMAGAWTMPDPVDGHTHGLASLDDKGDGRTTSRKGETIPDHDHEIKSGRIMPVTVGEKDSHVSRHPGTYIYDSKDKKVLCDVQVGDLADGKPLVKADPEKGVEDTLDYSEAKSNPEGVAVMGANSSDKAVVLSDANVQATTLRTLAAQVDRLESDNRRFKVELKETQNQRDQYKSQMDTLQEKNRVLLVDRIVDLEVSTGRKNVKDYQTPELLKARKDELLKREFKSLLDTAEDLQKELIVSDSAGTRPGLEVAKPSMPVAGLGDKPKADQSKSNDSAARFKEDALSIVRGSKG